MMFASRHMPCPECGASLDRCDEAPHRCDPERLLDYRMFALRHEVAWFDPLLASFLDSPEGRFETWLAARDVHGA
jgi:hypothetical protein